MVININGTVLSIINYKQEYFEFKIVASPFLSMFIHLYALFCFRHIYLIRFFFQKVLKISLLQIIDRARKGFIFS